VHDFAAKGGAHESQIRMLADCGLRVGEMLALRRELQDLKVGIFTVKGMGLVRPGRRIERDQEARPAGTDPADMPRDAPLDADPDRFRVALSDAGRRRVRSSGGLLWRYDNWRRDVWLPTCEAAGIDPTPQEFRASWETHLLAAGANTDDVAAIAGHSINVQAEHYRQALHRSSEFIKAAIG
jgi:integrase